MGGDWGRGGIESAQKQKRFDPGRIKPFVLKDFRLPSRSENSSLSGNNFNGESYIFIYTVLSIHKSSGSMTKYIFSLWSVHDIKYYYERIMR